MSREALDLMVGRAVVDRAFRALLLTRPRDAGREYDLSEFERRLLTRIRADSLAGFAGALERLLDQAPTPPRSPRTAALPARRRASA